MQQTCPNCGRDMVWVYSMELKWHFLCPACGYEIKEISREFLEKKIDEAGKMIQEYAKTMKEIIDIISDKIEEATGICIKYYFSPDDNTIYIRPIGYTLPDNYIEEHIEEIEEMEHVIEQIIPSLKEKTHCSIEYDYSPFKITSRDAELIRSHLK